MGTDGQKYVTTTDLQMDGHMDGQCESIISTTNVWRGMKNVGKRVADEGQ